MIDPEAIPLDQALQAALPTVVQPRYGTLPPLEIGGRRIIVAANGLFMECRSRGLHALGRIADFNLERTPYGETEPFVRFGADGASRLPDSLLTEAVGLASDASPREWAGLILQAEGGPILHVPELIAATSVSVGYQWADIDPLDVIADLHSHGEGPAYFSSIDDADDLANPSPCFVAAVIGNLGERDGGAFSFANRLVMGGHFFDLRELCVHHGQSSLHEPCEGGH